MRQLTRLRHHYPILRRARFLTGEYNEELGIKDVTWLNAGGTEMTVEDWSDGNTHCFGVLLDGRAQPTGVRRRGEDASLLMVLNAYHDVVDVTLPEMPDGGGWRLLLDTNGAEEADFAAGDRYTATGHSVLLFALQGAPDAPAVPRGKRGAFAGGPNKEKAW